MVPDLRALVEHVDGEHTGDDLVARMERRLEAGDRRGASIETY